MTNDTPIHAEDILPVRSRISWGAIVAGSLVALAVSLLLTMLGSAIGLSVRDNMSGDSLAIGGVVWAVLVTAGCLFLGGFIASQMTTGENKVEGVLYGILVWAVVFGALLFLAGQAARAGFSAMIGVANTAAPPDGATWQDLARRAGVPENQIAQMQNNAPEAAQRAVNPENATRAAWYTFLGTLISMLAAAIGGYVGSGPTLRLFGVRLQTGGSQFERRDTFVRT